jgi:hypothetical protein
MQFKQAMKMLSLSTPKQHTNSKNKNGDSFRSNTGGDKIPSPTLYEASIEWKITLAHTGTGFPYLQQKE